MITQFNGGEEYGLQGLSLLAQVVYLRGIRPYMNYDTGIAGNPQRRQGVKTLSLAFLAAVSEFLPDWGSKRKPCRPTHEQVRAALEELKRHGMIEDRGSSRMVGLVFLCANAHTNQFARNRNPAGTGEEPRRNPAGTLEPSAPQGTPPGGLPEIQGFPSENMGLGNQEPARNPTVNPLGTPEGPGFGCAERMPTQRIDGYTEDGNTATAMAVVEIAQSDEGEESHEGAGIPEVQVEPATVPKVEQEAKPRLGADTRPVNRITPEQMPEIPRELAQTYIDYRMDLGSPLSVGIWRIILAECEKARWLPEKAVRMAIVRGWRGIDAKYLMEANEGRTTEQGEGKPKAPGYPSNAERFKDRWGEPRQTQTADISREVMSTLMGEAARKNTLEGRPVGPVRQPTAPPASDVAPAKREMSPEDRAALDALLARCRGGGLTTQQQAHRAFMSGAGV